MRVGFRWILVHEYQDKASVRAVLQRRHDQSSAERQHCYLADQWELVLA